MPPPVGRGLLWCSGLVVVVLTFMLWFYSNPNNSPYFHTFWAAGLLLDGHLGSYFPPPDWLERAICRGDYYTAFPLGAVLTQLPVAALDKLGWISGYPSRCLASLIGAATVLFGLLLANAYQGSFARRMVVATYPVFASWMWPNLVFAGSWQLANGMGVAGQLGALYFIVGSFSPLSAGFMFAAAVGNRTELVLLVPLVLYLVWSEAARRGLTRVQQKEAALKFMAPILILIVLTALYNYLRFDSEFDFGNMRIPGVSSEPGYQHGLLSLHAISINVRWMLLEPWHMRDEWPWYAPDCGGCSIFLACPYLFSVFRFGARPRHRERVWVAIAAIVVTTAVLWVHGNQGGYQFSYRYAMELLPWVSLIILETAPLRVHAAEALLYFVSIPINAWGTYMITRGIL